MEVKQIKNASVYPYSFEFTPLLRYKPDLWQNIKLFSPNAWGLTQHDAAEADGGAELGIIVNPYLDSIYESESLVIPEYKENNDVNEVVQNLVQQFIKMDKDIYYFSRNFNILPQEARKYKKLFFSQILSDCLACSPDKGIERVEVPIIIVCGLLQDINKFDVQLAVHRFLSNRDKKVSCITSKSYASILGFYTYPDFVNNNSISWYDRTLMFNSYVKQIEAEDNPDAIVIEIPGGIMAYSDGIHNGFGFFSNMVFNAITPDYTCLCLPFTNITNEYLELLKKIVYYRFNTMVDSFCISNRGIDTKPYIKDTDVNPIVMDYSTLETRMTRFVRECEGNNIFCLACDNGEKTLGEHIIRTLEELINV